MKGHRFLLSCITLLFACAASAEHPQLKLFKNEDFKEVVDVLSDKKDKSVEDYQLIVNANLQLDLDDAEEAATAMNQAFPNDPQVHLLYASVMGAQASDSVFSALGYAKKAKNSLIKAVEVAPEDAETYMALIGFHLNAPSIAGGDTEEALNLIDVLRERDTGSADLMMAHYMRADDREEEAAALLNALTEKSETRARAFYRLGNMAVRNEDYAKAIDYFEQASEGFLSPQEDTGSNERVERQERDEVTALFSLYRIGWVAVESKAHHEKGVAALKRYLDAYDGSENVMSLPSPSWARIRLVEVLLNQGDLSAAKSVMASVNKLEESEFKKHHKKLTKRLKKA